MPAIGYHRRHRTQRINPRSAAGEGNQHVGLVYGRHLRHLRDGGAGRQARSSRFRTQRRRKGRERLHDAVRVAVAVTTTGARPMIANYPRNCWYAAAVSDEVGRQPLSRRLLDRPVVLYRQESGQIVALADSCGHRGYPLSKGRVKGANIECGYHGFQYDPTGACVQVPSQPYPPYGACVARYPIREIAPFVWIWLGEPGRAHGRRVPALPWLTEQDWA